MPARRDYADPEVRQGEKSFGTLGGEAKNATAAFKALARDKRQALLRFLGSL